MQVSSLAMIAAFFAVLSRSNRRPELKWWARAWTFNLGALSVTSLFWFINTGSLYPLITGLYVAFKTAFALLLAQGAWLMIRPGHRLFTTRALAIGLTIYGVAAAFLLVDVTIVGIVEHSVLSVLLIALAIELWRSNADAVAWLTAGVALRGLITFVEASAYLIQWKSPASGVLNELIAPATTFLSASSSFDMGAEWLMVLGSVLTVSERGRHALEASHDRLVLAQEDLRRLADRDPLTGATNRRAMREIFKAVHSSGATLLFFDLDGFKKINDDHGHAIGDACLRQFATALIASF